MRSNIFTYNTKGAGQLALLGEKRHDRFWAGGWSWEALALYVRDGAWRALSRADPVPAQGPSLLALGPRC